MKKYPKIVQVDSRGQIVIPKDMRNELNLSEGDGFFIYSISDEGLVLKKISSRGLKENRRIVEGIEEKSEKIGISKSKLKKAVQEYEKDKKGNLELI